jgi:hypothetical protein
MGKPYGSSLRFSLRGLLVLVAICSVWLGMAFQRAREQVRAVAADGLVPPSNDTNGCFRRLAQALSALYARGTEENRWSGRGIGQDTCRLMINTLPACWGIA